MKKSVLGLLALLCLSLSVQAQNPMNTKEPIRQTAGHKALGNFAPEFAHLNDDVLFGEVWNRQDELSLHDRSLVTVISLMSQGLTTDISFRHHLENAKAHGVSREEMAEVVTHAAFYMGWPKAWATFRAAKEIWPEGQALTREEFQMSTPYPVGEPNKLTQYFSGKSYLAPMDRAKGGPTNVTFEPGARNNWHIHHKSVQVLICVAGRGWYQEWGKPAVEMRPGTVIAIPAETKHWHGAARDSWFQHLAYMTKAEEGAANEWLEPLADSEYAKLK